MCSGKKTMMLRSHIAQFFLKVGLCKISRFSLSEIRRRANSSEIHFGFHFNLNQKIVVNEIGFPLEIRPILSGDIPQLFYASTKHLTHGEIRERLARLLFLKAAVPTCFVALAPNQFPCALCWLIKSEDNDRINDYFKGGLPQLKPDEVFLEFVFVHPEYRGKGLMEWISKKLFEQAKSNGANRAIAFVRGENLVSLAATRLIGWKPYLKKHVNYKFFKRGISYEPMNGDSPEKQPDRKL
jgi:GNAT superfamily N-acetyltransferase